MLPFGLVYSDDYVVDLGAHVFPTEKYRLVKERLVEQGIATAEDFIEPRPISDDDVLRVHTPAYVEKIRAGTLSPDELARLEVPFSAELVRGVWLATGGTRLAAERALEEGMCFNLSGGYHHAFADHGEGFCLINDVAVAVASLRARGRIERAALVDLDVHQGNGSAAIFSGDSGVFTFSMHQQSNYPLTKPESDRDIGMPDGAGDELYLEMLRRHLPDAIEKHRPELIVYLAGADAFAEDLLGGLALTREGLAKRDRMVFSAARALRVPVAVVLAGGYAARTDDTVAIHVETVKVARDVMSAESPEKG